MEFLLAHQPAFIGNPHGYIRGFKAHSDLSARTGCGRRHTSPGRSGSVSQLGGRENDPSQQSTSVLLLLSWASSHSVTFGQVRAFLSSLESERLEPDDAQAFSTLAACGSSADLLTDASSS